MYLEGVGRSVAVEIREKVVTEVISGKSSPEDAARKFGVGLASVGRWVAKRRRGESLAPLPHGGGAPRLLDANDLDVLRTLMTEQPRMSVADLCAGLRERTGKEVSLPTILREFRRVGIRRTRDVAKSAALQTTAKRYGYKPRHRASAPEQRYPSSVTDREWALVSDLFDRPGPGRPSQYPRRLLLDAISYAVRSGCSWRMLPKDFPPWQNVYATFRRWVDDGLFEQMHDRLRAMWRERQNRDANPTAAVIDSQSVKTAEKGGPAGSTAARRSRDESATS